MFVVVSAIAAGAVLAVFSGQRAKDELAVRRFGFSTTSVALGEGWFQLERHGADEWSWSSGHAKLRLHQDEGSPTRSVTLRFSLGSVGARSVVIRQGADDLWRGDVRDQRVPVVLHGLPLKPGLTTLEFSTDTPGVEESAVAGGRTLAFAIFNVRIEAPAAKK